MMVIALGVVGLLFQLMFIHVEKKDLQSLIGEYLNMPQVLLT